MSDLQHQTVDQLKESKRECENYIRNLKSSLAGQTERLNWIDRCIFQKDPQELTIQEIESKLGHKVILKAEQ